MNQSLQFLLKTSLSFIAALLILSMVLSLSAASISPSYFVFPAFFALGFPLIWLVLTIFLPFYYRRRILFRLLLVVWLLSLPVMLKHFLTGSLNADQKQNSYKILTYNVQGFTNINFGSSKAQRKIKIVDFVNEQNPDVLCMQEYLLKQALRVQYPNEITYEMRMPYKVYSNYSVNSYGSAFCLMIASKYRIKQSGTVYSPEAESFAMYADIQFPEGVIRVYNLHLESVKLLKEKRLLRPGQRSGFASNFVSNVKGFYRKLRKSYPERAFQVMRVRESVLSSPYPVVIAGDINDTPASYAYGTLSEGFQDAAICKGQGMSGTFAESPFPIRIDHILFDKRLVVGGYARTKKPYADHYPVMAGFSFR
jgi:endonuclease/exonuclease/phosphatase family metal-dependent hydrolase